MLVFDFWELQQQQEVRDQLINHDCDCDCQYSNYITSAVCRRTSHRLAYTEDWARFSERRIVTTTTTTQAQDSYIVRGRPPAQPLSQSDPTTTINQLLLLV